MSSYWSSSLSSLSSPFYQLPLIQSSMLDNSSSNGTTSNCLEFDPEGIQYIKWIYIVFGECVHSGREQASFYIGMASLFCWILALLPQIIANFKNKDASSLSIGFLIPSTIGDTCNMIACILSGQLMTQIFVATYFVMVDVVIIGQYIFYSLYHLGFWKRLFNKKGKKDDNAATGTTTTGIELAHQHHQDDEHIIFSDDEHDDHHQIGVDNVSLLSNSKSKSKLKVATITILATLLFVVSFSLLNSSTTTMTATEETIHGTTGRKLHSIQLFDAVQQSSSNVAAVAVKQRSIKGEGVPKHNDFAFPPKTTISLVGFIIGCICSVMYMFSRWPQIYKNYKRQSTEGLSKIFFILAIFGNLFYLISIWLFSSDGEYLLTRLPWLAETHLNVCLDTLIFAQIIYYSKRREYKDKVAKLQQQSAQSTANNANAKSNATSIEIRNLKKEEIELHEEVNQKETISTIDPSKPSSSESK